MVFRMSYACVLSFDEDLVQSGKKDACLYARLFKV